MAIHDDYGAAIAVASFAEAWIEIHKGGNKIGFKGRLLRGGVD